LKAIHPHLDDLFSAKIDAYEKRNEQNNEELLILLNESIESLPKDKFEAVKTSITRALFGYDKW